MAHGDYHCCAICDCKMAYSGGDARTKEDLCGYCAFGVAKLGLPSPSLDALMAWIRDTPLDALNAGLTDLGYNRCFYGNDVDDLVASRRQSPTPPEPSHDQR